MKLAHVFQGTVSECIGDLALTAFTEGFFRMADNSGTMDAIVLIEQ